MHIKPLKYSNLSKGEKEALEDLQEGDDIVTVNADSGGAFVVMYVTDYIEKAKRQITWSITTNYQKINWRKQRNIQ